MTLESNDATRVIAHPAGSRLSPRADTIGSLLRDDAVVRAARRSSPADGALLDDAVRDAIMLQEEMGLDVITDGEVRRAFWAQTPRLVDAFTPSADADPGAGAGAAAAGAVAGTRSGTDAGALSWRHGGEGGFGAEGSGGRPTGHPVVVRRIATAKRIGDATAEYAFLARYARARTKFTLAAPSYHRRYWSPARSAAAYDSCEEYLTEVRDYLRTVVDRLVALGCDYIQLNAPNYGSLCDPDARAALVAAGRDPAAELAFDAALDSSLFAGLTGLTSALHVCRGSGPADPWHSAGGYGVISAALFPKLAVDRLLLEYDAGRPGGFEALRDVRPSTEVVLGLLSTKSPRLEYEDDVLARIAEAARHKPLAELALSTQCGFASVPAASPVTPAVQRAKLNLVVRLARRVWS